MANRNTVKSTIVTKNVPTVTNAILTDMLNGDMNDNLRFREDYAGTQTVASPDPITGVTVDFTGYDRVDVTRLGGDTVIVVSGIGDGEEKWIKLTKTAGTAVTWSGVTDITTTQGNVNAASIVVYQVVRKGTTYLCRAWVQESQATAADAGIARFASSSEVITGTATNLMVAPGTLPNTSQTQRGLAQWATDAQIVAGTDTVGTKALVPKPSQLLARTAIYARAAGIETIAVDDTTYGSTTITHNLNLSDYNVMLTIENLGVARNVSFMVSSVGVNSFVIQSKCIDSIIGTQNFKFHWLIMK